MKLLLTALLLLLCTPIIAADEPAGPLTPEAERATFQLPADLEIQLVACEPHVLDPVHIAWDSSGKMFVCEMGDYPQEPAGGQIRLLEDRDGDGDGVIDHSTVFADDLHYPTSTLPYRGGVLVSAAPDILFLKDTDGDNKADVRKVLFTGFGEGNQQLRVNSLIWGLDGWVYGANGRSDGEVKCVARAGDEPLPEGATTQPVSIRGRDFRFHPELGVIEPTAGFSQFGHAFDDDGNRFLSWNTVHIRHVVLDPLSLTPYVHLSPQEACNEIADHGSTGRIYPASSTTKRFNPEEPGYFNASCGLTIFRGDALPEAYRGNAFVCEPLSNLVHRDILKPDGVTFIASRDEHEQESEFLASTDSWFRPVNLTTGPDGALYVVDFYRELVEHPQFVANVEAREKTDFRKGNEVGRIWRIVAKNRRKPGAMPNLVRPRAWPDMTGLTEKQLVDLFQSENGWVRDMAQRQLVESKSEAAEKEATQLSSKYLLSTLGYLNQSLPRIHALWTYAILNPEIAVDSWGKELRIVDRRVTNQMLCISRNPKATALLGPAQDSRSRLYAINLLMQSKPIPSYITEMIVRFWRVEGNNDWYERLLLTRLESLEKDVRAGIASSVLKEMCQDFLSGTTKVSSARLRLVETLARLSANRLTLGSLADELLVDTPDRAVAMAILLGQAHWYGQWNTESSADGIGELASCNVPGTIAAARKFVDDLQADIDFRRLAIRTIGLESQAKALPVFERILNTDSSPELVSAAISALGAYRDPAIADVLLAGWPQATPALRRARLDVLLSRREYAEPVVAALEAKELAAADFDAINADRLLRLCDEAQRVRAEPLLKRNVDANRAQVIASLQPALQLIGDSARGSQVFVQNCRTCHAVRGVGNRIGPDLASVANRPPADVLVDILDPSRNVAADGMSYVVSIKDGRILSGLLGGENATSITLKRAEGEDIILRSEIEELRNTGRSLMPEGLEKNLNEQAFADLLAFLKKGEPPASIGK
jgi:putative membrane-bound dehydrogenase-like protein